MRAPLSCAPRRVQHTEVEYERESVMNIFLLCEPLRTRRWTHVRARCTKIDWAHQIKGPVEVRYPAAERLVLVMDNLHTHSPASLYEAFPPAAARRLADKLEIHHTPTHGSWLTTAKIELNVFSHHCLDQRVPDVATL